MRLRLSSIKLCMGEAALLYSGNRVKLGAVHFRCDIGMRQGDELLFLNFENQGQNEGPVSKAKISTWPWDLSHLPTMLLEEMIR